MRDTLTILESHFVCNNGQTFIHLHYVGIDNFSIQAACEVYSELRNTKQKECQLYKNLFRPKVESQNRFTKAT